MPLAPYKKVVLRTYSKPNLTSSLLMRNSTAPKVTHANETNIVYEFKCPDDACQRRSITYIGLTTTTLKRRMQGHRNSGAIHEHFIEAHDRKPEVKELVDNTSVINKEALNQRLRIAEAVSIELRRPNLNVQAKFDLVLPSHRRRRAPIRPLEGNQESAPTTTTAPQGSENNRVTSPTDDGTEPDRTAGNLPPRNYRE